MGEYTFVQRKKRNWYKEMVEMTVPKQKKQRQVKQHERNWLELPFDLTANILYRIGVIEILENAQKVCTTWRKICKDPSMWRVIHMKYIFSRSAQLEDISKCAVDRSQGQLVDINIVNFVSNKLLQYVAKRSSQLKRLEIISPYRGIHCNWSQALKKFSMLEELNLYKLQFSKEDIKTAGRCCPMLRTLKLNQQPCKYWHGVNRGKSLMIRNRIAKAIGKNLPELRHLELIGNHMTNIGLQAILDGCRYLESLDLRRCLHIDLKGYHVKKCLEKIKSIKLPEDTPEACPDYNGTYCVQCTCS